MRGAGLRARRIGAATIFCALGFGLAACGAGGAAFGDYDLPDSAAAPDAPWPRLAEAEFPQTGPAPEAGAATADSLTIAAAAAAARAEALAGPIMTEAEAERLRNAGRRSR